MSLKQIANLSALVTLGLDHNRFTGPIPPGVSGMKALGELRLDHNALTGKLEYLGLTHQNLAEEYICVYVHS